MTDINMSIEEIDARHGRYVARIDGVEGETEITFTRRAHGVISADHTGAPDSMRGTGAAAALVTYMVEDARKNGFRILPLCPYVRAQYRRHPDWADVMTLAPGEEPEI
ncbi:MAG: N-acetyltransferase [Brucellaceae bacterium]|jgi:predicted GNAT family acetyltransferase|nr:N-acetyltransferase [Brucellaceae bacterium]